MDEVQLLLEESRSLADECLAFVDSAVGADTENDAKEAVIRALHAGEELKDRLEEALDFAESEDDQIRIENAIVHVEDAVDDGHLALTSGDIFSRVEDMRMKIEDSLTHLSAYETVEGVE